jgi:hypothetical protein
VSTAVRSAACRYRDTIDRYRGGGIVPDEDTAEQRTPEQLLATALESLPSQQRQQVTAWLLAREPRGLTPGWLGTPQRDAVVRSVLPPAGSLREVFGQAPTIAGEGYQVVPVRLPVELHARLRDWSAEHGFSMATVVRGLVSRFLDSQAGERQA